MSILHVIVLAMIQGLTEFLPISSSAHLFLTSWLFGWEVQSLDFDIMLHLGTLVAVLLYFAGDWLQIVGQAFGFRWGRDEEIRQNRGLLWLLAVGSLPIGIAGLVFSEQAETTWRNPYLMGGMLLAVGALMWLAESGARRARDLGSVGLFDSIFIGAAQALAIVPGCSRSGITISAGLFRNMNSAAAARFSFLLSTPAITAAAAKALYDVHKHGGLGQLLTAPFAIGVLVSAGTGCAVIGWFLHYLRRSSLRPFVYYRFVFGIIVLALAFIRGQA
jgi:undecaprenyl-diphosphatase